VDEIEETKRLELWQPRTIASRRVTAGRTEIMSSEDRWAVVGASQKAAERGEVQIIRRQPVLNPDTMRYEVIVRRLRNPRPRWFWPMVIAGVVLVALAALTLFGLWAFRLTGSLGGSFIFMAAATLAVIWVVSTLNRPRGKRGAVEVDVHVRVR